MLKKLGLCILVLGAICVVVSFESSLIPLHREICEKAKDTGLENCASYNFVSYALWKAAGFLDSINTVITAVSTFAVAIFTFTLWWSTRGMLRATNEIIRLARQEFLSTHRPKLRVRNVVINDPQSADGRKHSLLQPGHVVTGQFYLVNVGESRADILDGHCMVFWNLHGLPMSRPYEGAFDNLQAASRTLLSGESTPVLFRSDRPMGAEGPQIGTNTINAQSLFVMGWITYCDRNNDVRRTSFCRKFLKFGPPGTTGSPAGRFYIVEDPDYEHEE